MELNLALFQGFRRWFNMLSAGNLFAQDLILSLGGQPTQFALYSDTVNLEPIAQTIIKRAEGLKEVITA